MNQQRDDKRRPPQEESAAERQNKKNPANQQDLGKPPAGRDEPPSEATEPGKRSPDSPWMGGG
jgi:hypothetical protein